MEEIEVPSPWKKRAIYLGLFALGMFILGAAGALSGAGWFGYRSFMYGEVQVYLLNLSDEVKSVKLTGHSVVEVPAQGAEILDVIGGELEVQIQSKSGSETLHLFADDASALVKLSNKGCLALTHLNPYYGGKQPEDPSYEAFVKEDRRVYVIPSRNIVWPRKTFPKKLDAYGGPGIWVELVGCELFDDKTMLDAYVVFRLMDRMQKALHPEK